MRKNELITDISKILEVSKNKAETAINSMISYIQNKVVEGQEVKFKGFGNFFPKYRAPKKGRNIQKNISIEIPATTVPAFKPAAKFVETVKKNASTNK